jgi:hypothetical protein
VNGIRSIHEDGRSGRRGWEETRMGGVGRMLSGRELHAPSTLTSVLSPIVVHKGFSSFWWQLLNHGSCCSRTFYKGTIWQHDRGERGKATCSRRSAQCSAVVGFMETLLAGFPPVMVSCTNCQAGTRTNPTQLEAVLLDFLMEHGSLLSFPTKL